MRSKLFLKDFKRLMLEADEAEEDQDPESVSSEEYTATTRLSSDSVDDQIDGYFLKFESDSISEEDPAAEDLQESLFEMSLSRFLTEQEEDDQEDPADEAPSEEGESDLDADVELEASPPTGSEDPNPDIPSVEKVVKIPLDIDLFTKKVVRLSMNANYLLDVREVIVNRALNFLLDNYDKAHVDEMQEILNSQFDFNLDQDVEEPDAPHAVGAWAGGTGGLGGGGG